MKKLKKNFPISIILVKIKKYNILHFINLPPTKADFFINFIKFFES